MVYLITFSNGRPCTTATSMSEARRLGGAAVYTRFADGDLGGYFSRADLYRDRNEGAYAEVVLRPIDDPRAYLTDDDLPAAWREAVRQAIE